MKSWVYCLPTDVLGEGAAMVVATLRSRARADGIVIAVKYHASRDVLPHNPRWRVASLSPGVFYRPRVCGQDTLAPTVSPLAQGRDVLAEVTASAAACGMDVSAWAVMLHEDSIGADHPAVQVNCWGDGAAGVLCPAHPAARAYVQRIAQELTTYPIASVRLESLHYHGLHHGHHHERLLDIHTPLAQWLLGLCFCGHCRAAAAGRGVDTDRLRGEIRRWLTASFDTPPEDIPLSQTTLAGLFGEDILGYVAARQEVVSSLVGRVVDIASAAAIGTTFVDITMIGAGRLLAAGQGQLAADAGWIDGIDVRRIAATGADVEVTGYVDSAERLASEVASYRAAVGEHSRLGVILRPGPPDCTTADELAGRVAVARGEGCDEIAFYNYGLYRLTALDRIRAATESGETDGGTHG